MGYLFSSVDKNVFEEGRSALVSQQNVWRMVTLAYLFALASTLPLCVAKPCIIVCPPASLVNECTYYCDLITPIILSSLLQSNIKL